jgi:hypothetical protein
MPEDPSYPNPNLGDCPAGTLGVADPDQTLALCTPECDGFSCPDPASGDATPTCGLSPSSSFDPCSTIDDCSGEEQCIDDACVIDPPTHCVLLCDQGQTCPDGMTCFPAGVCAYPF